MSVRDQVLTFLRETARFSAEVSLAQRNSWLEALAFAENSIAKKGDWPLRPAQQAAWRGLASARAGLILGPPGTGKTHLLSWLAVANAAAAISSGRQYRVFVTAFTRNAAGNLLSAIAHTAIRHLAEPPAAVFLGNPPPAGLGAGVQHIERLDKSGLKEAVDIIGQPVVFVACSIWSLAKLMQSGAPQGGDGWTAPLFDLVCIDEASQLVLGHGLMALAGLAAEGRVVVAGDDRQLPPVRAIQETLIEGRQLGSSLYSFLSSVNAAEFVLEETFRLNAPLAVFPASKFYDNRYVSADPIAARRLKFRPNWDHGLEDWERAVLDPEFPIAVLLHDGPPAATSNEFEVILASRLARHLRAAIAEPNEAKFWEDSLAIVSPHRAQNAAIRASLGSPTAAIETVERIQGKERDALILSYCVSDPEFALAESEFIFSRERFNVAITRARSKLIIIISRRLLDIVPPDQEVVDSAELIREFVYSCQQVATLELPGPHGIRVSTNIRVRGFSEDILLPVIGASHDDDDDSLPELTPGLQTLLEAIRACALANTQWGTAASYDVANRLARNAIDTAQLRDLLRLGYIGLEDRTTRTGMFWSIRPFDPPRRPFPVSLEAVEKRIEEVILGERTGRNPPFYRKIRNRFVWVDPAGNDVLRPQIEELARRGMLLLEETKYGQTVDTVRAPTVGESDPLAPLVPGLSDRDFVILNALEDLEVRRINFGIVESWTSVGQLASAFDLPRSVIAEAVGRLETHGFLMVASEQRLRSRMAELSREVRYVKQRFAKGDANRRPFLVRNLKIEARGRRRPRYDHNLSGALDKLRKDFAGSAPQLQAIDAVGAMLSKIWGQADPMLAGFQVRGMREIALSWHGRGSTSYVVSAETGSGKTEAACLPLILGAAVDRINGINGTRAVLVYPRVRLAANQAQRLARYLAALACVDGMPTLTLGLQTGQVPQHFSLLPKELEDLWPRAGQGRSFPFFACPECSGLLNIAPNAGIGGADSLVCVACNWRYDGWIGSKQGLERTPPNFFMPTTESLHKWMHEPRYAGVFGDLGPGTAPRAILADEIHLYTHIHGAQVGYALRRLLARAEQNQPERGPVLAIGMSATLGQPAQAWARLCGRSDVTELQPEPSDTADNPRAREYFYFVQPEVESRGRDIAGAATTIQSLMCLAHGMRRRTGKEGGYRSLVFLNSIDKLRRLHAAYSDAEEAKCLAGYRTHLYDDAPNGDLRTECCGEPIGCDAFRDGECWYFAATDERQWNTFGRFAAGRTLKVSDRPIFSGTTGRAEDLIKGSDIVFTTSSLEVGYDDPDIALVYQHYAPSNLASFVQRKGRAGRGSDDRSITAVTLSPYSARDSWYFRRPALMIEPSGFEIPLNPENLFVVRGQLISVFLDGFARFEAREKKSALDGQLKPSLGAITEATSLATRLFGTEPWRQFGATNAAEFWEHGIRAIMPDPGKPNTFSTLRRALPWAPDVLFDTINLPALFVSTPENETAKREDATLALATAAPGNITRRFDNSAGHWIPPAEGLSQWLDIIDYSSAGFESVGLNLELGLPTDVRQTLAPIHPKLFRPRSLHLSTAGKFWGADWDGNLVCDQTGERPVIRPFRDGDSRDATIHHESRSSLLGCIVIDSAPNAGQELSRSGIEAVVRQVRGYTGHILGRGTSGLVVTQLYWGADAEIRLTGPKSDPVPITQQFKHPQRNETLLHGYRLDTEGVQIQLDSGALDAFINNELQRIKDTEDQRWFSTQMFRYLLESRARCAGVNGYDARRGADLLVSAAGDPELKKELRSLLHFWDDLKLKTLLENSRKRLLAQHPLLTNRRVEQTAAALSTESFRTQLSSIISEINQPAAFAKYLRSAVLHSLAVRLKQSFVLLGHGDDARVLTHVRLPIQFGDTNDIITLAELGEHGDGTTRAFVQHVDEMLHHWRDGFLAQCPSARDDAVVDRLFALTEHHSRWRALDPRRESDIRALATELGGDELPMASAVRILFGSEIVGHDRFDYYDLTCEIRDVATALHTTLGRPPNIWELVSGAVAEAEKQQPTRLAMLLKAYQGIEDAAQEESLGASARLADQVYRLSARLCVDGCQTCVHTSSDLMPSSLVESSTSRRLLENFLRF